MTPQAMRAPALPVVLLSSWPPRPRSSGSACTTRVRPMMLFSPVREMCESQMLTYKKQVFKFTLSIVVTYCLFLNRLLTVATPPVGSIFPKSPTWRTAASGPAWSTPFGLKWGPADMHPFVLSPNSWTWNPCFPSVRADTSPVTLTAEHSDCNQINV